MSKLHGFGIGPVTRGCLPDEAETLMKVGVESQGRDDFKGICSTRADRTKGGKWSVGSYKILSSLKRLLNPGNVGRIRVGVANIICDSQR